MVVFPLEDENNLYVNAVYDSGRFKSFNVTTGKAGNIKTCIELTKEQALRLEVLLASVIKSEITGVYK